MALTAPKILSVFTGKINLYVAIPKGQRGTEFSFGLQIKMEKRDFISKKKPHKNITARSQIKIISQAGVIKSQTTSNNVDGKDSADRMRGRGGGLSHHHCNLKGLKMGCSVA